MTKGDRLKYISAKDLGNLALPKFCPRCFWFERHFGPFPSRFPGIFNVLDGASKKSVQRSFLKRNKIPDWLNIPDVIELLPLDKAGKLIIDNIQRYLVVLHRKSGWTLRGTPDSIFKLKDNTIHIVDYKTAKFTQAQDDLYPMYEVQLNGYALLAYKYPVSKLSLVYCEPNTELNNDIDFTLGFLPKIKEVELKEGIVSELLMKAREIVDQKNPPPARLNCKETCFYIDKIYPNYHSIIIEESLRNPKVFKKYKILRTKFSVEKNWHLHIVEIPEPIEETIKKIQKAMLPDKPYYFHIYNQGKTLIVVFKDKVFHLNPSDQSTWREAREYGASQLNIPAEELNFYPSKISEEEDWYIK